MRGLPASAYLDPARGALEASTIFGRSWQFVCHVADLPAPGTAARFDCAGRSAFVLRTRSGALRAFLNACRHRGARLVEGDASTGLAYCVDGRIRCPYHGWTYDDAGVLESIPVAQQYDELDATDRALPSLPVAQWRGLVFLALGAPERPLEDALGGVPASWPDASNLRRLAEPRVATVMADWKLVCEHRLDQSHLAIASVRAKTRMFVESAFAPVAPDALHATAAGIDNPESASWSVRAYHALASRRDDANALRAEALFVWPNLWLQATPGAVWVTQVLPRGPGASTLRRVSYGQPASSREVRLSRFLEERAERRAEAQVLQLLQRVQLGLASVGSDHRAPLAASESALRWFATRCAVPGAPLAVRRPRKPRVTRKRAVPVDA